MIFWGDEERLVFFFIYLILFWQFIQFRERGFGLFCLYIICEPA